MKADVFKKAEEYRARLDKIKDKIPDTDTAKMELKLLDLEIQGMFELPENWDGEMTEHPETHFRALEKLIRERPKHEPGD